MLDHPDWSISMWNDIWAQSKSEAVNLMNMNHLDGGAGFSDEVK